MTLGPNTPGSIAFGRFRVLPHRRELRADDEPIKLGARAFDLLMALIETPGAVVSKDDLLARVWPNRVVAESNLQTQILALRQAFRAERNLIRTVAGRGYQFTGEIRIVSPVGKSVSPRDCSSRRAMRSRCPQTWRSRFPN
jgi:DNA-binding winged helix-turn-helix (wHTH) protein